MGIFFSTPLFCFYIIDPTANPMEKNMPTSRSRNDENCILTETLDTEMASMLYLKSVINARHCSLTPIGRQEKWVEAILAIVKILLR